MLPVPPLYITNPVKKCLDWHNHDAFGTVTFLKNGGPTIPYTVTVIFYTGPPNFHGGHGNGEPLGPAVKKNLVGYLKRLVRLLDYLWRYFFCLVRHLCGKFLARKK
jgi:hypothetical protein